MPEGMGSYDVKVLFVGPYAARGIGVTLEPALGRPGYSAHGPEVA